MRKAAPLLVGMALVVAFLAIWRMLSAPPSGSASRSEFESTDFPSGVRFIDEVFHPKDDLVWGPIEESPIYSDTHILGAPMSRKSGFKLSREAVAKGVLIYRVEVSYSSYRHTEVSVRDGQTHEKERDHEVAKLFGVDRDLVRAFEKQEGFVQFRGRHFLVSIDGSYGGNQTVLSCTYENQ